MYQANNTTIEVSEIFWDTIQGEGVHAGHAAIFFRVKNCWMNCVFCDTRAIWRTGRAWTISEILEHFRENGLIDQLNKGVHLVITGGSPLMQQKPIIEFIHALTAACGKKPFIEIENEVSIVPKDELFDLIDTWNCSPKLTNSLVKREIRYNIKALKQMGKQKNAWFKFVINKERLWKEIEKEYLPYIPKNKIMLMPEGDTVEKIDRNLSLVEAMAKDKIVQVCDRLHIRKGKR